MRNDGDAGRARVSAPANHRAGVRDRSMVQHPRHARLGKGAAAEAAASATWAGRNSAADRA
jgi:hypothetical protein